MKLIIACTYIFLSCEETFPLREGNFSSRGRKFFLSGKETFPIKGGAGKESFPLSEERGEETFPCRERLFSLRCTKKEMPILTEHLLVE